MLYKEDTAAYNARRLGKPWIAKVTFDSTGHANYEFGNWVGNLGGEGRLEITVEAGEIVATGQKDFRRPSPPQLHIVAEDGSMYPVTKVEALDHYRKQREAAPTANAAPGQAEAAGVTPQPSKEIEDSPYKDVDALAGILQRNGLNDVLLMLADLTGKTFAAK